MLSLLYISLFTFLAAWIDSVHLNKNEYIENHTSRWLLRALFVIAASNSISDLIGMTLVFTALFDGILNKLRYREVMYLGTVAEWDKFWRRIPFLFIIMKVVCLFVGIFLCLI